MQPPRIRPLNGVRVLDLSRLLPGPFATLVLSDLGASIDKLEDPETGDYLRHIPPLRGGVSVGFQLLNRDKRSGVVDLKKPEGREAFLRLLSSYDVLVEQYRPGVLERLGLAHAFLLERHPRLIVCALTGYGQSGPLAHRAGHDLNYVARAGVLGSSGPGDAPPPVPGAQLADVSGALWAAIAILAALRERDSTGRGGVCDISMCEGALGFAVLSLASGLAEQPVERGGEFLTGGLAAYGTYRTADGKAVALAALEPKFWVRLCHAIGIDPEVDALRPGPHQDAIRLRLEGVFAGRTRDEWTAFAAQHHCCLEPILAPHEVSSDPHLAERESFFTVDVGGERVTCFNTPVTPRDRTHVAAPSMGRDTRSIFRDAGFDDASIDSLFAARAIA